MAYGYRRLSAALRSFPLRLPLPLQPLQLVASQRPFSTQNDSTTSTTTNATTLFSHFEIRQTRFNDSDLFGHINNTVYYNYMDDAINVHLIQRGIGRNFPRFIAENGIQFYRPIHFPNLVGVGIRIVQLSNKAATYDVGFYELNATQVEEEDKDPLLLLLQQNEQQQEPPTMAARGKFVHVYVNEATGRPVKIPSQAREVLQTLVVEDEEKEDDSF